MVQVSLDLMPEKEALEDEVETERQPELLDREGMYTHYRPPVKFPMFNLWDIFMARLRPLRNYCIACCCLLILGGIGAAAALSDETLKTHIETVKHSDYELIGIRGVTWTWNMKAAERFGVFGVSDGVLAQEVEQVYPWAVLTGFDGFKRVNYLFLHLMILATKLAGFLA